MEDPKSTSNNFKEILERNKTLIKKFERGIRCDMGCGHNKQPGFFGIDILDIPGVDLVWDLENVPYPLPSGCASIIIASHIVEHINPHKGKFIEVMNEWWRLMRVGGKILIATPYAGSFGYWVDPTHVNPCNEVTWYYFDPETDPKIDPDRLWGFYQPKPWKIEQNVWKSYGNLEVVLVKRENKPEYYK